MEIWKDIYGFEGYQVSNLGNVRSFWRKKRHSTGYGTYRYLSSTPVLMSQSDDGNGYLKVCLYSKTNGKRYCKKVHRLVAEAFIPMPDGDEEYTVDHIKSGPIGKLDNSIDNLRWMSRRANIQKAYNDGCCDERILRSQKPIMVTDLWTGDEMYFSSIREASDYLKTSSSSISHALRGDVDKVSHYIFEYAGPEENLLYEHY